MTQPVLDFYSANEFREYPFDKKRDDGLHALFVDAYVMHTAYRDNPGRLRIASFNPAGDLELRFEDGILLGNLTSADGFISSAFGRFVLYEWRKSVTYGVGFTSEDLIARLVVIAEKLSSFSFPVTPLDAYLLSTRVNPRLRNVVTTALAFPNAVCCLGGPNRNALQVESGYNLDVSQQKAAATIGLGLAVAETVREPETVYVSASKGDGLGVFPNCETPGQYVRSVNGALPNDEQDFQLGFKDCTWEETRLVGSTSAPVHPNTDYLGSIVGTLNQIMLQIHQACRACCDCPDYGRAYDILYNTWSRAKSVNERFAAVRNKYHQILSTWGTLKTEREVGLKVALRLIARPDFHVAIAVHIGNSSHEALNPLSLQITTAVSGMTSVYTDKSGYVEMEGTHNLQKDPEGVPHGPFYVSLPAPEPGKYVIYRLSIRYNGTSRANKTAKITATAHNAQESAYAEKTIKLLKPLVKE